MKKKLRILGMLVLAAVFIGSLTMVILRSLDYRRGEEAYAEAESLVQLPDLSGLEIPEPAEPGDEPEQGGLYRPLCRCPAQYGLHGPAGGQR